MNQTKELVKTTSLQLNTSLLAENISAKLKVGSDYTFLRNDFCHLAFAKRWADKGFVWQVGAEFVRRFRHAATVAYTKPDHHGNVPAVYNGKDQYWYVGNLPQYAIERMVDAMASGITVVTIHSNEPLPIRAVSNVGNTDPVLVGWESDPNIRWTGATWDASNYGIAPIGTVLAIWDEDGNPTELS